jgi:hypothetical protein
MPLSETRSVSSRRLPAGSGGGTDETNWSKSARNGADSNSPPIEANIVLSCELSRRTAIAAAPASARSIAPRSTSSTMTSSAAVSAIPTPSVVITAMSCRRRIWARNALVTSALRASWRCRRAAVDPNARSSAAYGRCESSWRRYVRRRKVAVSPRAKANSVRLAHRASSTAGNPAASSTGTSNGSIPTSTADIATTPRNPPVSPNSAVVTRNGRDSAFCSTRSSDVAKPDDS